MFKNRPGDSHHRDILHFRLEVFGPEIDGLIREVDTRIDHHAPGYAEFLQLVESWPWGTDGNPEAPDALATRLRAIRDALPPVTTEPELPPAQALVGSGYAAILGAVLGGGIGIPLGFLAYLVARETVMPTRLWSSDGIMWGVIITVAGATALLGARQGAFPTRAGRAAVKGVTGFFIGALVCGVGAGALALMLGALFEVSQREGAFAMGVAFTIMPLSALIGGVALAVVMARKALRA